MQAFAKALTTIFTLLAAPYAMADHRLEALGLADALTTSADELQTEARTEALYSETRGRVSEARHFRQIASEARLLANSLHNLVLEPLYDRATDRTVLAQLDRLTPACDRLARLVRYGQVPWSIANAFEDVLADFDALRRHLDRPELWFGSCRVVRETIWGDDLQDYYGEGSGDTRIAAINAARADGVRQCERDLGSLQQCTVVDASCTADQ